MDAFPEPGWRANVLSMAAYAAAFPILSSVLLFILELAGSVSQALPAPLWATLLYGGLPFAWGVASYTVLARLLGAGRPPLNPALAHLVRASPLYLILLGSVWLVVSRWRTPDAGLWIQLPLMSATFALGALCADARSIWPQLLARGTWRWGRKAAPLVLGALLLGQGACRADMPPGFATPWDSLRMATDAEIATLRLDTASVFGLSTEGALLEAAYSDSTLRRLRATYYGETGRAVETFYYDAAGLAVVHRVDVRYTKPLSGEVADSTVHVVDLRSAETTRAVADSVVAEGANLLSLLRSSREVR